MAHFNLKKWTAAALAGLLCGIGILNEPLQPQEASAAALRKDSGISYTEAVGTIPNPGMGYTTTLWYRCKPGNTPVQSPVGSVVLMFIDIGAFSSGENGVTDEEGNYTPGQDYLLDDSFFAGLRGTFENCRNNGSTIALRFRYDDNGTANPEPETFDMLKTHLQQIGDSGLLTDYQDILMFVESGMVGCYGEQWGGKYCSLEHKAELLDIMLDIVPDPIPVTVRTPNIFAKWAGITNAELADWVSEPGSRAARVGLYNDGYMGSNSDLGTYSNREIETTWLGNQTLSSYFGGEFSGNLDFAKKYDTYLPENAVPEMYKTHLSYINGNIFQLYKDYTFGAEYDVAGVDNSAYYGQNVFQFIRDHLGYRFVLRKSELSETVEQGGVLDASFSVENTGFANPARAQRAELLLEKDGNYLRTDIPVDSRTWRSCTVSDVTTAVQIPGGLEPGEWNLYLKLSVGNNTVQQLSMRSVQFANPDVWHAGLGANYLGSVTVTESDNPNNRMQTDFGSGDGTIYTLNGQHSVDGDMDENEALLPQETAESTSGKIYVSNDENYLYITAEYNTSGTAEVHNIQFTNKLNDTYYWLYYASNGFIYFNHGTPTGCLQKHRNGIVEFRIPLGEVMGLEIGAELSNVRYFLQDSANEWKLLTDVRLSAYTLTGDFPVYHALRTVSLHEGAELPLFITDDAAKPAKYQWYHDGKAIAGATDSAYTITDANSDTVGMYSVEITSATGTVKTVDVCLVKEVYGMYEIGDVDGDGKLSKSDVVALQQYLLTKETTLANWSAGDLDGVLTGVDLSMLKRLLAATT